MINNKKQIEHELNFIPKRFHEEFLNILKESGKQTPKTIRKNCEYFLEEIIYELNNEEKKIFININ